MRGAITTVYVVHCGRCDEPRVCLGCPRRSFVAALIGMGWLRTRRHGWVCPQCKGKGEDE